MRDHLKSIIDHIDQPVLVENPVNGEICLNKAAIEEFELSEEFDSSEFQKYFSFHIKGSTSKYCYYAETIYYISIETFSDENGTYRKYSLSKVNPMLNPHLLEHYKTISEKFVHQFRSPLTGAKGFIEMLKEDETNEKKATYLNKIEKALDESFEMLQRATSFAQSVTAEVSTFPLDFFVQSTLNLFAPEDRDRILMTIPETDKNIISDFSLLQKTVSELLKNALEATPQKEPVFWKISEHGIFEVENKVSDLSEKDIEDLSLPYNSSKALHMGLGLPTCQYYCHIMGLNLYMHFNPDKTHIIFTIQNIRIADPG
ncbi:MAG: HAMP domain-containing sensor histidine kinase [Balneolaceae bacterium]